MDHITRAVTEAWGNEFSREGLRYTIGNSPDRDAYCLILTSETHQTTHYLPRISLFPTDSAFLAKLLDEWLIEAVKEHKAMSKTEEVPLFSEAVVGYRRWKLTDWVLSPTNYGSPWRPGVNTAKCQPHSGLAGRSLWGATFDTDRSHHENPPHKDCHCGLNAFFDYQGESWMQHSKSGSVIGAIVGWGKMEVHPDGFRAEYAQIVALYKAKPGPDLTDIAALYQVPVVDSFEALQIEASKHGSPLPENLRPPEQDEDEYGVHRYAGGYTTGSITTPHGGSITIPSGVTLTGSANPYITGVSTTNALGGTVATPAERQKEMLDAAKKANLVKKDGTLKSDKQVRLEKARKKHRAMQEWKQIHNPKKKPWRV